MAKQRVCSTSEVPEGQVRTMQCDDRSIAVSHIGGEFYAIEDRCTHDNGPLGEGRVRGTRVICPRHGAAFDARTGKVLALPAVRDVHAFAVTVEGDDVYVECDGE